MIRCLDAGLWAWMTRSYWRRLFMLNTWITIGFFGLRVVAPEVDDWRTVAFCWLVSCTGAIRTRRQLLCTQPLSGAMAGLAGGWAAQTGQPVMWGLAASSLIIGVALLVLGFTRLRGGAPQGVWLRFANGVDLPLTTIRRWCPTCREHHHAAVSSGGRIRLSDRWHRVEVDRPAAGGVMLVVQRDENGVFYCPGLGEVIPMES